VVSVYDSELSMHFLCKLMFCVISGFRCEVYENCILLGCFAVWSENSLPTFRDNL